jgi:UDP-N-acetylmuramoyl-tripeptide--D-alanyl-D-alanine ligase
MLFSDSFQISLSQLISILSATASNLDLKAYSPKDQLNDQLSDQIFNAVSTDTRKLQPGNLFLALKGENFDGHNFVERAIAKGARAAVVSQLIPQIDSDLGNNFLQILVPDTLIAYQTLAKWWRIQTNLPVIAITGSAGKTTTKELIAAMLANFTSKEVNPKKVHKSEANFNNDIGVAQTLLAIAPKEVDFVVLEMGMRGRGEIARLAQTAIPNIGVITNIGTAHIGRLGSQVAIAESKCELLAEMPADGIAVLNGEDQLLVETAKRFWNGKTITYGISENEHKYDISGRLDDRKLEVNGKVWQLPLSGRHNALNFLAGLAVLAALGLDWQQLPSQITNLTLPDGRAQIDYLPDGVVILDQTYNASPEATIAALNLLAETPANRRWAVLGANRELGEHSQTLHFQIGQKVKELGIDFLLVLADPETDAILIGAGRDSLPKQPLPQHSFTYGTYSSHQDIAQCLIEQVLPGDCILFKASHSVGMEQAVNLFRQFKPEIQPVLFN